MAEAEATISKWEGKASAKVRGTAEQVWPFVEDFLNLHKWLPSIDTCYKVEGVYGQPGLIRYCGVTTGDGDKTITSWAHEKLLMIDPIQRCLSYEVIESNVGFSSHVATWKVIPINGDDQYGCEIEWSFITGPIDGWKNEDFLAFVESGIQGVAERIDKALQSTS